MSASVVLGFCQDEATRATGSSARESSLSFYPLKLGLVSVAAEAAEKKQPLDFIDVEHQPFVAFFFLGFYNYGYFLVFHIYVNIYGVSIQRCVYIYTVPYIYIYTHIVDE